MSTYSLLSALWLREPDAETLEQARQIPALAPHCAEPGDPSAAPSPSLRSGSGLRLRAGLAMAYADLFLLNVYPYASVFLDPNGEMNGARAQRMRDVYEHYGYAPGALRDAGAPDHIGLMLGLLAHTTHTDSPPPHTAGEGKRIARRAGLPYVLDWAPVLCLAVEREPGAHSFYRALASETRRVLFAENEPADPSASLPAPSGRGLRRASLASHARRSGHSAELELELESGLDPSAAPSPSLRSGSGLRLRAGSAGEEVSLRSIVHWLLCPARSGVFLSRARLGAWARGLDVPLPFGGRFDVGVSLFEAARVVDGTARLVDWLMAELEEWDAAYAAWSAVGWGEYAVAWRARIERAARMLANMKEALLSSLPP